METDPRTGTPNTPLTRDARGCRAASAAGAGKVLQDARGRVYSERVPRAASFIEFAVRTRNHCEESPNRQYRFGGLGKQDSGAPPAHPRGDLPLSLHPGEKLLIGEAVPHVEAERRAFVRMAEELRDGFDSVCLLQQVCSP